MRSRIPVLAALAIAAGMVTTPMSAAGRDRVYADSFGNLVVESGAGYKRIIVGQGDQAKQLSEFVNAGRTTVTYADSGAGHDDEVTVETCHKPGTWVKRRYYSFGRSADLPADCW